MKGNVKSGMKKINKIINNAYIKTFLIVFFIIVFLYIIKGYAPFGNNTLAIVDAEIQYLDFFSYFRDVLLGINDISYSLGSGLGQNMIAVFSYYLMSPLNLLVVFFDKMNLEIFFNLLVLLKLSIASITFVYFLKHRFIKLENFYIVLLSVSYALCQYNIAQASNIMWLDGVYMLPLILLGVYNIVNEKKSTLLICSTFCSILFNWYTGLINCLFSFIWFTFEIAIYEISASEKVGFKIRFKRVFKKFLKYVTSMIVGGLISSIVLLPTIISLQSGRGNLQFNLLKDWSFIGDFLSVIPEYTLGATSQQGLVSLFCGSLALVGCLGSLCNTKISKKEKILFWIFLIIFILMFYWKPIMVMFSLVKDVSSYWYRYSYIGIFAILFFAAYFYRNKIDKDNYYTFLKIIGIYIVLLMILSYIFEVNSRNKIYFTIAFLLLITLANIFINYVQDKKKVIKNIAVITLYVLVIAEFTFSTSLLMETYHTNTANIYANYVSEEEKQIDEIKNKDKGFYRITQTSTRNMDYNTKLTANYNEPLAFNYWGISSYTSDPDENQRNLLNNLGYKINGENMNIVNTSILGADSFLGVKYVLSSYPINGLEEIEKTEKNGKKVYENPYVLPLAFTYNNSDTIDDNINPFEYQNELYSHLLNEDIKLYVPLKYSSNEKIENGKFIKSYELEIPNGNYAVYGNLYSSENNSADLKVNNSYNTNYFCWLAPSVFYIPTSGQQETVKVELLSNNKNNIQQEQFYALQLDVLKEISNKISERKANIVDMENGKIHIKVENNEEVNKLLLTIPYDSGWKIIVNNKEVKPEKFLNCLISIPLENGNNDIEMKYELPYLKIGIAITIMGIILLLLIVRYERKQLIIN